MRAPLLLFPLLSGCVFLGRPPAMPQNPAPPPVHVDFSGVFGGQSVRTLWNHAVDRQGLMERIVLDEETLQPYAEDSGTEPWTLQLLLSRLGTAGTVVLSEPLGPPPPPTILPDGTEVAVPAPSGALRNLRFLSGTDEFPAVVEVAPEGLRVRSRLNEDEPSLCSSDFALPLGYVYLRGTLQKLPLGEVVAVYDELALTPAPPQTAIDVVLPASDDPGFCPALADQWETSPVLARRDAGYVEAAGIVLDMALAPVLP